MNSSNRYKAIFYAVALLVCGGVIGYMIKSALSVSPQTLRVGRVDEITATIRDHLSSKLDLDPEQKQRIEPMIKQAAEEMETSHFTCLKQVNKAVDDLHAKIKPELRPEQQAKLVELETEWRQRMSEKYNYQPAVPNLTQH